MLTIDGSFGEGGGQIVRSALALSLATGRPFAIEKIRAARKKPGLGRQHLTAVRAAMQISGAEVEGAELGSARLVFCPGQVRAGEYQFNIGTAGSTTLVLQTILPALLVADGPSSLILEGGTHNPLAPPFDFLAAAYLPLINRMGPKVEATLDRPGFYPAGGGRFRVRIAPAERLEGFELIERGKMLARRVRALVSNLPTHIGQRECDTIAKKMGSKRSCFAVEEIRDAVGPGNVVLIELRSEHVTEVFAGFGQRGVRAEQVARNVLREAQQYLASDVPVGVHLADQLMLPLGISAQRGSGGAFRTMALTPHATTQIEVLRMFLDACQIDVQPQAGDAWLVRFESS